MVSPDINNRVRGPFLPSFASGRKVPSFGGYRIKVILLSENQQPRGQKELRLAKLGQQRRGITTRIGDIRTCSGQISIFDLTYWINYANRVSH